MKYSSRFSFCRPKESRPLGTRSNRHATELKNDCACVTSDPVGKAVGAKISTWATHSRWQTIESLDFAVKFQSVFRYETVVFRRYVLALVLVVLLWKFEAYLGYIGLIWAKFPRRFLCFQKFRHFSRMFPGFPARISDMRNRFSALSRHAPLDRRQQGVCRAVVAWRPNSKRREASRWRKEYGSSCGIFDRFSTQY